MSLPKSRSGAANFQNSFFSVLALLRVCMITSFVIPRGLTEVRYRSAATARHFLRVTAIPAYLLFPKSSSKLPLSNYNTPSGMESTDDYYEVHIETSCEPIVFDIVETCSDASPTNRQNVFGTILVPAKGFYLVVAFIFSSSTFYLSFAVNFEDFLKRR
jgi:hypothetical protein